MPTSWFWFVCGHPAAREDSAQVVATRRVRTCALFLAVFAAFVAVAWGVPAQAQSFTVEQKAVFDREATERMMRGGTSVITGQAFAKDNKSRIRGAAIFNINPRQFAPEGTVVTLVPWTPYFREWVEVSKVYARQGKKVELPQEARDMIRTAHVTGNEGRFEFRDLGPGDFYMYVQFGYEQTHHRVDVVGYQHTYVYGVHQGASAITEHSTYGRNETATIDKYITIRKDGDVVAVDLKKTR